MKKIAIISLFHIFFIASLAHGNSDTQALLNTFHQYSISKCDNFILNNSHFKGQWKFFINKHVGGIDGVSTEVSAVQIFGVKNDTVKIDYSYIQTQKACFLHQRSTITSPQSCADIIDNNTWRIVADMPDTDYTVYKNNHGVELYAKDISIGEANICLQETSIRKTGKQG
jgi:hypothetical protein